MSKPSCCAIIIIFLALVLRLSYAMNAPLTGDEKEFKAVADTISFNSHQMNLPVEHDLINHPLLSVYLLKLGAVIFPGSKLGTRIFSLASALGTFIILYIFCRLSLGEKHAIVAMVLLGLNRFHIGVSGNGVDDALLLFLIIFAWTPPHFWALALYRKNEYASIGMPMLPVTHGDQFTKLHVLLYTIILCIVTTLPYVTQMSGLIYLASSIVLNGIFMYYAIEIYRNYSDQLAREAFRYSILYLALLFVALLVDHYFFF